MDPTSSNTPASTTAGDSTPAEPIAPLRENESLPQSTTTVDVAPILSSQTPLKAKFWTVGTLTYTSTGLVLVFFWLLFGDFALSMRDRSVGPVTQLFLKSLKVSDTTMALLVSTLPQFIGMVLGPIVSYKSDRFRSRWGRRIPFLLIPTPIAAAAMVCIAFTPQLGTWLHSVTHNIPIENVNVDLAHNTIVGLFSVFWTIFEVAVIISGAVLGGLINDVVPRQFLGRFYGLFRAVSLIDGMIFNYLLLKYAETHFTVMFAAIGIVFGTGFTLMCLKVKEGNYPPPDANPSDHRAGGFFAAIGVYFNECFSRPHYLWCFAAFTLGALTFLPINLFSILYAKQLNMDMQDYGSLVAMSYFMSLILAYPIGWLVDKFHALRVAMVPLLIYSISCIYGSFYITNGTTFGVALVLHTVLSGSYFTATASLGQALLPRAKFSQYASAGGLVTSISTMLLSPLLGVIMDHTDHNYRLTFVAGLIFSMATLALLCIVYIRFMRMGGPGGYIAPGDFEDTTPGDARFDVIVGPNRDNPPPRPH